MYAPTAPAHARLSRAEWAVLIALVVAVPLFGILVEKRNAFSQRRMTDFGIYARAGWAVRDGEDLYRMRDDNGWHYNYPPLLAIALVPLADPPAGVDREGSLPFAASVGIWYVLNILFLALAVHWLARAVEKTSSDPAVRDRPAGCRAWWQLRVVPVLLCLTPLGHTLMRGQLSILLLLLISGMVTALVDGRRGRAGVWLAGAICVKIIPAYLLLYPLCRRDWRFLGGCGAGLFVGLLLIPALTFGPARTVAYYRHLFDAVLLPGMTHAGETTRAAELTDITATKSQSILPVLHNTLNPDRATRPAHAAPAVRMTAMGLALLLTGLALLAGRRALVGPPGADATGTLLLVGALLVNMLLFSPIFHLHFFALLLPLALGLVAAMQATGGVTPVRGLLLALFVTAISLPQLPALERARDFGMAMYGALGLWLAGLLVLRARRPTPVAESAVTRIAA